MNPTALMMMHRAGGGGGGVGGVLGAVAVLVVAGALALRKLKPAIWAQLRARSGLAPSAEEAERLGGGDDEGDDDDEDEDDEEEQLPRATEADEDNVWSAVRGAGEEGVEFVKTAIPTYREELSSDAARALPGEGEHC